MKVHDIKRLNVIKVVLFVISFITSQAFADVLELKSIKTRSMRGNKAQILMEFSGVPQAPEVFSMDNPAKMVMDFGEVKNSVADEVVAKNMAAGVVKNLHLIETDNTLRLIINVFNIVPYEIEQDRNRIIVTLDSDIMLPLAKKTTDKANDYTIKSLDFRRGDEGEGRIILEFNDDTVPIDFRDENDEILIEFKGATIPENLQRRFDVKDFGTNIAKFTIRQTENDVVLRVLAQGEYEKAAYQINDQFIVEIRPLSETEMLAKKEQTFKFTGEKISLNFQDIEIRAVLQLLADFTGLNIVSSDSVSGNVTLRLENIPWDQALDFILKSKGLAKREERGLLLIAPNEEIRAREQLELESMAQAETISPLMSEFLQINYAKASDIASTLKSSENTILSERGQISVDERTNIILLKDTVDKIIEIKKLLEKLDIPVKQVMIEAQIVEITDTFSDALGIKFGGAATPHIGRNILGVAPVYTEARTFADDPASKTTSGGNLFFDFGETSAKGKLGLALAKLPGGTLLDLELQASEFENKSNTIARPKLMTLDQQTATIETGQDVPYITNPGNGADSTVTFRKAVLKLDVTPQITPNEKIAVELTVNQDTPGDDINGQASINTTSLTTNVLVDNGDTVVLGGIFKIKEGVIKNKIPYLADVPLVGRLFRGGNSSNTRTEVLIFVTPRIVTSIAQNIQ